MRTLLTGASGYIGRHLLPRLLAEGHRVRCLVRDTARVSGFPPTVEIFSGNVLEPDSLAPALKDIDCAYYLIHSMAAGEAGFAERDRQAALNFAEAARQAGVPRVIYLGGLGCGLMSEHLKSRQEVGEVLRSYGPPTVEFRAGIIVGAGSASFEIIRSLAEKLPVMICPRWVTTRVQPIAIADVIAYLVSALETTNVDGQVIEIGGSSIETYRSMIDKYARLRGLSRRLIRVPVLTPRLSSYWLDFVTSVPPAITRPLIEGLKTEVTCRNDQAATFFPQIRPIGYLQALESALDRRDPGLFNAEFAAFPQRTLHSGNGVVSDCRQIEVKASRDLLRDVLHSLGGGLGWLYADWLWELRGWMDKLVGGVGMRRRCLRVIPLHAGDEVDFWRVQEATEDRLLLRAEMKVPGKAWLQFCFAAQPNGTTRLRSIASFEPRGVLGRLYWWVLYLIHRLIFAGMLKEIAKLAENRMIELAAATAKFSYGVPRPVSECFEDAPALHRPE